MQSEAFRVGPPGSGSVHTRRPLMGITPQPSVGPCGENTLRLLLARARISTKSHFTRIQTMTGKGCKQKGDESAELKVLEHSFLNLHGNTQLDLIKN